jgi:hypothetical protein
MPDKYDRRANRLLQEIASAHSSREARGIVESHQRTISGLPDEDRERFYAAATDIIKELPTRG